MSDVTFRFIDTKTIVVPLDEVVTVCQHCNRDLWWIIGQYAWPCACGRVVYKKQAGIDWHVMSYD